jgi:sterol 3beta-glucosyltransferase
VCSSDLSPTLSPSPRDWPARWQVVGHWLSKTPPGWQPPADLLAFLEAGPPPLYLGFGSMLTREKARITQIVFDVLDQTQMRAIVTRGWNNLTGTEAPGRIFLLEQAPHAWLFPRMAMIVHHGGSGTTGAALSSGVPSMAVPYGADQPFWGRRLYELGVGSAPIPYRVVSAEKLAPAIRQMLENPAIRRTADLMGETVRAEDGIGTAVAIIQRVIAGG